MSAPDPLRLLPRNSTGVLALQGTRWAQYLTTAELAGIPENKEGTKGAKQNWRKQLGSELQKASNTEGSFHKRAKKHVYEEMFESMRNERI
jgi:hypothetical protein